MRSGLSGRPVNSAPFLDRVTAGETRSRKYGQNNSRRGGDSAPPPTLSQTSDRMNVAQVPVPT
jgi:hypothetical protein